MVENNSLDGIYKLLFNTAAEGLVVTNAVGEIVVVNPRVEEMFGFSKQELLGNTVEMLIPDKYRKKHVKHREGYVNKPLKRSMGKGITLQGKRKSGELFPVEISLNFIKSNGTTFSAALISDVTSRKNIEDEIKAINQDLEQIVSKRTKELHDSQVLYRLIAQNYPNGVINVFDDKFNYVFVEGKELRKHGITSEKLVGTNYLKNLPESVSETIKPKLVEALKGVTCDFEIEQNNNYYLINIAPLIDQNNKISQILLVEQNITKQKEVEQKIAESLENEKQINELKSRFVSTASHEFRTPLSSILSSVSLLDKYINSSTGLPEEQVATQKEKHLKRIKTSVTNLTNILNDFLSLDKLENNHIANTQEHFILKDLVLEVWDELDSQCKKGQTIKLEYSGVESVFINRNVVKSILLNLVSNAIKYSSEDQEIKVACNVKTNMLELIVEDNGVGIPEAEQTHLFERFFRAKNVNNIQGTGLGLTIVKKYLDVLGGAIQFSSEENKGTRFEIQIPFV